MEFALNQDTSETIACPPDLVKRARPGSMAPLTGRAFHAVLAPLFPEGDVIAGLALAQPRDLYIGEGLC